MRLLCVLTTYDVSCAGVQKRNQVLWLQEVVRQLQTQFNTRCAALRAEKEEVRIMFHRGLLHHYYHKLVTSMPRIYHEYATDIPLMHH